MIDSELKTLFDCSWKISNEYKRCLIYPYVRFLFAANRIAWGKGWRLYGSPIIQKQKNSSICFGNGLQLRSTVRSNPLGPNHPVIVATRQQGAVLEVGFNFGMTGGALCSAESIIIGNNVVVGANSTITDTDFHPVDNKKRRSKPSEARTAEVVIGDDVFIGMNCMVLKGVRIGKGSVVGAGSVVTKDVPSNVVVAGNPAQIIREI